MEECGNGLDEVAISFGLVGFSVDQEIALVSAGSIADDLVSLTINRDVFVVLRRSHVKPFTLGTVN